MLLCMCGIDRGEIGADSGVEYCDGVCAELTVYLYENIVELIQPLAYISILLYYEKIKGYPVAD